MGEALRPPRLPVAKIAGPQQARSTEKRRRLLAAGRTLFGRKGYERTSIDEISAAAGTAAGTFYQHFPSKRELLLVLMNELIGQLNSLKLRPQASGDVRNGLRRFLAAVFRVDREYYGVVRAWREAVLTDPQLAAMQREIEAWTRGRILGVFRMLRKRSGRDLPGFARMMDHHFWSLMARGERIAPREIALAADVICSYLA